MIAEELLRDKYEVLHRLGGGTGGAVYKAIQLSTKQAVAVKLLSLDNLMREARERPIERFRREIAFYSRLYHPDIVRLLDSGELQDGTHFAVFEYIPGQTLAQLLSEEGALTVQRARSLMMQLLPPLAYAHTEGIFHRDLKPSNVMVTGDGPRDRLKILDFGISIAVGHEQAALDRLTLSHEWVGTPTYAAPEQLRGEPPGAKSDLYAWGLIFLECLTGTSVVAGSSLPEIIQKHLLPEPHPLPHPLRNHRLGALLSRVLEKDPARRPSDADALLSMLEKISMDDLEDAQGYLRHPSKDSARPRSASVPTDTLTDEKRPEQVELRHATVVCCKIALNGSGEPSNTEQLDALMEDTNALARELMAQFGATVSQSFGEYSLSYFGLSRARDADARLAVRAALEAVTRLERAPGWLTAQSLALRVHIGIHNGPVTVRLREGSRQQLDGLTASVAMRLSAMSESAAPADARGSMILVSDAFRELVGRYAEFEETDTALVTRIPWRGTAITANRLSGESRSNAMPRFAERSLFVGREAELERLYQAWQETRGGTGVAALITGEPGMGKSRLALELRARTAAEGVNWIEMRCLPEWQNGFLRPLATLFVQLLGVANLSASEGGLRVEQAVKELGFNASEAVPLLCGWLSLSMPDSYARLASSPQKQRQTLLEILADILIAHMDRGAAVLVEDLHWADPSTLDQLEVVLRRSVARRSFLVMTARPRTRFSWSVEPRHIELAGLDEASVKHLLAGLLPTVSPADRAIAEIVSRSDGLPLYVEELAMAFRPRAQPGRTITQPSRSDVLESRAVPASLRDLLTGRLDDIGEAKGISQFAAALGREFSLETLARLSEQEEFALLGDLEQLVTADILVRQLRVDGSVYMFRHALIRDAAYDSMTAPARQRVHERIAEGLETHYRALVDAQPDVLAYHWEHAGFALRAVQNWQLAAKKSAMASAHLEALTQFDRALALLEQLPPSPERTAHEAQLLLGRGATLMAKRGYTDPDVERAFERVAEIAPAHGDQPQLAFAARWGLWYFHNTRANLRRALELAEELTAISRSAADTTLAVSACEAVCETTFCVGRFDDSVRASRRCEQDYDFDRHRHLAAIRGDDPLLASLSFEALAELLRGQHGSALQRVDQGLALAGRLGYPALKAGMHGQAAWMYLIWGSSGAIRPNVDRAREQAGLAMRLATEHGFPFWAVYGRMIDAAARIASGDLSATDDLRVGAEQWRAAGASLGRCWHLAFLAEALQGAAQYDESLALLDQALGFCAVSDSRYFEAELHRRRACVLADPANPRRDVDASLAEASTAIASAVRYGADWWHLAASVTRIRLRSRPEPGHYADLHLMVNRLSSPTSPEPPLLREARTLLRTCSASDEIPSRL